MIAAHALPRADEAELVVDGRSSILFATLAGVSLGLMTGAARPYPPEERPAARRRIALRALALVVIGLLLWSLEHGIAIILDYYGVAFLLMLPLLFLNRAWLIATAAALLAAGPVLAALAGRARRPGPLEQLVLDWLVTGYYPALLWLPLLVAGLLAARSDLGERRTQLLLLLGGGGAAVLGYGSAALIPGVTAEAHSAAPAEIVGSGGLAIAVLGILALACDRRTGGLGTLIRGLLWPIGAAGSMPLTVYTAQILALSIAQAAIGPEYDSWPLVVGLVAGSLLGASLWRATLGAGPMERGMRAFSGLATPRRRR